MQLWVRILTHGNTSSSRCYYTFLESVCRCISIQQSITRSGRMLSDEFLIDLDYVQPVQRGIRLDSPVVASCLRLPYRYLLL